MIRVQLDEILDLHCYDADKKQLTTVTMATPTTRMHIQVSGNSVCDQVQYVISHINMCVCHSQLTSSTVNYIDIVHVQNISTVTIEIAGDVAEDKFDSWLEVSDH